MFLPLLDVLVHELFVELVPEGVVDEAGLFFLGDGPGAVLEHHVVVPAPLDPEIGLVRRGRVPLLHQRVPG